MATTNSKTRSKAVAAKRAQLERRFIRHYVNAPPHLQRVIAASTVMLSRGVPPAVVREVAKDLADMWDDAPEDRR